MLTAADILDSRVTVIGAARSGLAAALLLRDRGAHVFLSESAGRDMMQAAAEELAAAGIEAEFGGHTDRAYAAELFVTSPGVPSDAPVLLEAARRGIAVVSEIELASWFCTAPIIAVTGTNGKTTTTALTGAIFRSAGWKTIVAGNIGLAFAEAVRETGGVADVAVLEVSSYQLDHCARFRPRTAMITTLTPDHLGRYHGDFGEYIASKQRVFMNQTAGDALIYSADDDEAVRAVAAAMSTRFPASVTRMLPLGAWVEGGTLMADIGEGAERIAHVDELQLRGRHNHMNVLMAALAARLHGLRMEVISTAVRAFKGIEHRLEFVRDIDGVAYINDSKATNVDSVVIALRSFTQPVVLIAGGRDKGAPYDPLLELIDERVRAIVLIGEAADRMERAFASHADVRRARDMQDAVRIAGLLARAGDAVLLSPACASFDMFDNFEHRGDVFKRIVHALPGDAS